MGDLGWFTLRLSQVTALFSKKFKVDSFFSSKVNVNP